MTPDEVYEVGYRDGESNGYADWIIALHELDIPDDVDTESPSEVVRWIAAQLNPTTPLPKGTPMNTVTTDPMEPTTWLNYRGRVPAANVPPVMGPTTAGELLYAVDVEYDTETDRTRVGLSRIAPTP